MKDTLKEHWERIYGTKQPQERSWTQETPLASLHFIRSFNQPKSARIIDVGGGDSKLVDYLLEEGYEDITVLDISAVAQERAKIRLGKKASKVKWIVADITEFIPTSTYDIWHDRATFHFLTAQGQIEQYLDTAMHALSSNGFMSIGTFSDKGPEKCSGLPVKQYSEETLTHVLEERFEKIRCITENHITPFNTLQNFLFCSFKRKQWQHKIAA